MATRRRGTRRTTTRRRATTGRRAGRRSTYRTTRRRRPKLATTLGSAAALGLLAVYTQASWPWRIGVSAALAALWVGYWLWSRRSDIDDVMQARTAMEDGPTDGADGGIRA